VVIVLLSLGLGIAFPLIESGLGGNEFKSSMRRLQGVIHEFRNQAILENTVLKLEIALSQKSDTGHAHLSMGCQDRQHRQLTSHNVLSENVHFLAIEKNKRHIQTSGTTVIHFSPQGLIEPTRLYLMANGVNYKVSILPFTGRLEIRKGSPP
jgi:Tfp pilus assembly protein FimT